MIDSRHRDILFLKTSIVSKEYWLSGTAEEAQYPAEDPVPEQGDQEKGAGCHGAG